MYEYRAKLDRVVDGDTVDVIIDLGFGITLGSDKLPKRVRLYGINTPETRTRDLAEKALGLAAKARVEELLADGQLIVRTQKDNTGKYGRLLGEIINSDGININDQLLSEGHAVEYMKG